MRKIVDANEKIGEVFEACQCVVTHVTDDRPRFLGRNESDGVFIAWNLDIWTDTDEVIFPNEECAENFLEECREGASSGKLKIDNLDNYKVVHLRINI